MLLTLVVILLVNYLTNLLGTAPYLAQAIVVGVLCLVVLFINWRQVFLFVSSLLNVIFVACCSFFQSCYARVRVFLDGFIRPVINPGTTPNAIQTVQTRF